jgi:uncharacterized peroxidase-related enzyme
MAHISVDASVPGIRSLVMFRPETGKHLYSFAQAILRGPSPLSPAERELIATYVSAGNTCRFCMNSHAAASRSLYGEEKNKVDEVLKDPSKAPISDKMKILLNLADKVRISGREVEEADIIAARENGVSDVEIHDTVLIAAGFSMFNRYVDGLASLTPEDPAEYTAMGDRMAANGYVSPPILKH